MSSTRPRESAVDRIRERVEEKAARRAAAKAAEARAPHPQADRPPPGAPGEDRLPGITADTPTEIPWRGWKQILKRAWAEHNADNMPIIAGGVAFWGFLSIFPALIATISLYGLVASPETVTRQIEDLSAQLPEEAAQLIGEQLRSLATGNGGALSLSLVVSLAGALWSVSGGMGNLITAVNLAYDEVETRNFVKLRATSLVLTLGAIVFVLVTFSLVAVVPVVLDALPLGPFATVLTQVARWVLLLGVFAGSLAVLYRVAPDRDAPKLRWVSLGAVVVTVVWALVSVAFSFYVDRFGSYNETYGTIAGVIVLMLWLYITCYLLLLGAEINSEAEHQTAQDTTEGPPAPMGERDAVVADSLPDKPEPSKEDKDPTHKNAG
ncbi:YihY/virulence factor BrkB family protein [Geodermatophilus sp. DSM 44513]|uniref:YihY/virulence factor BrkB family protein n=1 Tax=Geodermatophilus sp. DSM 44513 TaxID=1528104 RepID=UPI001275EBCC|nr:YihY/virulence factor BrkB family protein [Geodermatophilus sp. DSM 44513]WNV77272.1 YihY/virulence factor BrkB family protein [Geodermatophilus sp. DSM 44513]